MAETDRFPIVRITKRGRSPIKDIVVTEFPLTIILNNQELATLLCSPKDLNYLAIGFLFSAGLIKNKDEISKILVDEEQGVVRIETKKVKELADKVFFKPLIASSGGRYSSVGVPPLAKIESQITIVPNEVFTLVNKFQQHSQVYQATHGVHSAALCNTREVLVFSDDIGRHNAIDKVFGKCILKDIPTDDRIIIISGRISSEMFLKVAKKKIPILISIAVPTSLGVKLAAESGATLIGSVREERMKVYTGEWRVVA